MDSDEGSNDNVAVGGQSDEAWIWAAGEAPPPDVPAAWADESSTVDTNAYAEALAAFQERAVLASAPSPAAVAPTEPAPASPVTESGDSAGHAGRIVLGMAVLATERLGSPGTGAFAVGVGLAQQTAQGLRGLADRVAGPPSRAASRTFGWAARRAGLRANAGPFARGRERLGRLVDDARNRGQTTVDVGRQEASEFLQTNVTDGMTWAQEQAVPQMVDGLVPHLVDSVVPQIVDGIVPHLVDSVVPQLIDGVMPEIRSRVLPVIIDDLTNDPRLRDLVLEQSRGVVGEAAQQLRSASATADDRVEKVFRRLVGGGPGPVEPPVGASPAEPSRDG